MFFRLTELRTLTTPAARDEDEVLEPRVFTLEAARQLARAADVADMKTVVGLSLV